MTPRHRAERLMGLYRLRAQIGEEIAAIETAMAREQEAIRAAKEAAARRELCGTDSGYHHHRRVRKEPPCTLCKRAHAAYEAGRARRQREAVA